MCQNVTVQNYSLFEKLLTLVKTHTNSSSKSSEEDHFDFLIVPLFELSF